MRYWTRAQWGARVPTSTRVMAKPVSEIYIHHSVTPLLADPAQTVRGIQAYHMDHHGWADIAYQELIAHNGDVFEGRGFGTQGGATKDHNSSSLSICALGNFDTMIPPALLIDSIVARIVAAAQEGRLTPNFLILGHMDANSTECPGRFLYGELSKIRERVHVALHPLPVPDTPLKGTDMYFIYRLHKDALNAGEAVDWIVPPNGPKFHCPSTAYTAALKSIGAKTVDLTGDVDASKVFRNTHP